MLFIRTISVTRKLNASSAVLVLAARKYKAV